ncbi:MAG: hypothetical protein R6U57_12640 [Anaerolineales bacterium]
MIDKSKHKVMLLIFSVLLMILSGGCAGDISREASPTAIDEAPAGDVSKTEVGEEIETGEETATVVPTDIPPTPTVEPTWTWTPLPIETEVVEVTPRVGGGEEKENMIAKVKADLAARLGISEDEITVVSAEAKTWNDASLGCPEKGMMYAQVITPGYRIILEVDGKQHDYRTDQAGHFKLCDR